MSKSSNSATLKYKQGLLTYYLDSFFDYEKLSNITESWVKNDLALIRSVWDVDFAEVVDATEAEFENYAK